MALSRIQGNVYTVIHRSALCLYAVVFLCTAGLPAGQVRAKEAITAGHSVAAPVNFPNRQVDIGFVPVVAPPILAPASDPIATSSSPAAGLLIQQMSRAADRSGGAYLQASLSTGIAENSGAHVSYRISGNVVWAKPKQAALAGSTNSGTGPDSTISLLRSAGSVAVRGSPNGAWTCTKLSGLDRLAPVPVGVPLPLRLLNKHAPTLLGKRILNRISVWHVRETATGLLTFRRHLYSGAETTDLYIRRSDSSLRRLVIVSEFHVGTQFLLETAVLDFSHYGQHFRVKLPALCKGPTPRRAMLGAQLIRKSAITLDPTRFLAQLRRS